MDAVTVDRPVAPGVLSPIQAYLDDLHGRFGDERGGQVADYIPELGRADPEAFGICIATTDGRVYEAGDTRLPFTIQSMSKPFTYGLALHDRGRAEVLARIGVEPSGDAFNEISLEAGTGRPLNPMINAGAITAASLVAGATRSERFGRLLKTYSRCAGRPLAVDAGVFRSERETGHRNRAIGHMLRTFGILREDPDRALDLYFRQCAVSVDCRDMSLMAATLANGGRHPQTGERAFGEDGVQRILSVMTTCGMYDGSGAWVDQVGLPAKSGVSGGIFAVLPGQLGLCVYSPRLDERGNSVRGVASCRALAAELELHSLRVPRSSRSAIRAAYDVAGVPSRRQRPEDHARFLRRAGRRALVFELQGDLLFAGVERVVRAVVDRSEALDLVVLDLRPVHRLGASAGRTLGELRRQLVQRDKELLVVDAGEHADAVAGLRVFADLDAASEWCEEHLLAAEGAGGDGEGEVALADHALCRGCDAGEVALLDDLLARREIPAGRRIVRAGEPAEEVFLLVRGEVSVSLEAADGGRRRLATLPAGSTFGELAVLGRSVRTADVHAQRAVTVRVLHAADFERLLDTAPRLNARLLRTMLAGAHATVERMSREVVSLGRGR